MVHVVSVTWTAYRGNGFSDSIWLYSNALYSTVQMYAALLRDSSGLEITHIWVCYDESCLLIWKTVEEMVAYM